jgi:GAF domain-containing protein/anti-sigma regulatory factor (Ser/Thr protein kinase)
VAAALAAIGLSGLLILADVVDTATYAPLVGAAAITAWYGGLGPALVSLALGWLAALFVLTEPHFSLTGLEGEEVVRWLVALVVALLVVWASFMTQRGQRWAATRATDAERSSSTAASLQQLASSLSSAVTPMQVAHALVEELPVVLGSMGGALGVVEGDNLVIVDPEGAPRQTLPPGLRLPLAARAPIAVAARTGEPAYADSRTDFEREFPDGARLAPTAHSALAMPLRAGGRVVASMGFPFTEPGAIDEERLSLLRVAADLGGQALERASLYEQERATREGLDRVARLAPRFAAESPDAVLAAVCREAREALGADVAQVWDPLPDGTFEVLWREPPSDVLPVGSRLAFADFPRLWETMERRETMFVPDALEHVVGQALEHAKLLGIRSSVRVPIVLGGRTVRILALQWERVIPPPSPQTLALARRFADHAGLALESAERRRAQETAARSELETRRLLATTAALAAPITPEAVADACLQNACEALGGNAGVVARLLDDRLELIASAGYETETLAAWQQIPLDSDLPVTAAVRRNEVVALSSPEELTEAYGGVAGTTLSHGAWLAAPLSAGGRALGALWLSFPEPRAFSDADLQYASALSRQTGQALERALLLETEHVARARAERMASDLAQLHALATALGAATTSADVAALVAERVSTVFGADTAGIYMVTEDGDVELLEARGTYAPLLHELFRRFPLAREAHTAEAIETHSSVWLLDDEDWARYPQYSTWRARGVSASGMVPLLVEDRAIGTLFVSFADDRVPEESQRRLVETMARQAAQPLERARLLERERASRHSAELAGERTRRLYEVTARLSQAVTPREVSLTCLQLAARAMGTHRGLVALRDGDEIEISTTLGYADEMIELPLRMPLEGTTPMAESIRGTAPIWALGEADAERYAAMRALPGGAGDSAWLALPLPGRRGAQGALVLAFERPLDVTLEDREWLVALAAQCAQALDRSRVYDEERVSRRRSERLQTLTAALSGALTPDDVASVFLNEALPAVDADGAALGLVDHEAHEIRTVGWRGYADELNEPWLTYPVSANAPAARALQQGRPAYYEDVETLADEFPLQAATIERSGHRSFAFVPLGAGTAPLGVGVFSWAEPVRLSADERTFIEVLAAQCGLALDRARRYETERVIAETLQRSVLPETLPSMEGVQVAARYLPGTSAVDVGGDWFDTITLPGGWLGFVVGDVVGKGVRAASTMAQLRNGMRALTLDSISAGQTVTKLNRLLDGYTDAPFATLAYLTLDPATFEARLVSAGHLPPVVVGPDGTVAFLEGGRGLPLGVDVGIEYAEWQTTLEPGSTIVLYTDGLVERRDRSIDIGLDELIAAATRGPWEPEPLVDAIIDALLGGGERGDDVAVLALRLDEARLGALNVAIPADPASLSQLRRELEQWLERASIPEADARDVLLAAWEAGANAVEHSQTGRDGLVRLHASLTGDRVRVEVSDSGRWREPEPREDRGLGLRLMQSLMTVLDIDRTQAGTRVVMERSLTRERVGANGPGTGDG